MKKITVAGKIKKGEGSIFGLGAFGPIPIGAEAEAETLRQPLLVMIRVGFEFVETNLVGIEFIREYVVRGHHPDSKAIIDHPIHFNEGLEVDAVVTFLYGSIIKTAYAGVLYAVVSCVKAGGDECFFGAEMIIAYGNATVVNSLHGGYGIVDLIGRDLELFVAAVDPEHKSFCSEINSRSYIKDAGKAFFEGAIRGRLRHHEIKTDGAVRFVIALRRTEERKNK